MLVQSCHVCETFFFSFFYFYFFFFGQIHNQKIHALQENLPGVLCHTSHDLIPYVEITSRPNSFKSSVVGGKKKKKIVFPFVGGQHAILNVVLYFTLCQMEGNRTELSWGWSFLGAKSSWWYQENQRAGMVGTGWRACVGSHRLLCDSSFFKNFLIPCRHWYFILQ